MIVRTRTRAFIDNLKIIHLLLYQEKFLFNNKSKYFISNVPNEDYEGVILSFLKQIQGLGVKLYNFEDN